MQPQIVESGVQLFSRINHSNNSNLNGINPKLFKNGGPVLNETVEIIGDCRNDLLVDFLMRCILSKDVNSGFCGLGAVFVNCGHHISIFKITSALDALLKSLNVKNRKPVIENTLKNLTILNCYNDDQFEITLYSLEGTIQAKGNVSLVVVDDVIAQYWVSKQKDPNLSMDSYAKHNLKILQDTARSTSSVLVFSSPPTKYPLNLNVDYKIIGDKNQFTVVNNAKKSSTCVPFQLQTFITFL